MASLSRPPALVLLLLALPAPPGALGCAGGDNDTGGAVSFGGSNPSAASHASAPATEVVTDGYSTGLLDSDAMTTRPTEATRPTTDEPATTDVTAADDATFPGTTSDDATTADDTTTTGPVVLCGNATIDAPEECDGANLDGKTCTSFGFTGGTLVCTPQCIFDKSMCTSPSCGDGTVNMGEECDCGNQGANCTGAQLGNQACSSLQSPKGTPYAGGTLACNSPNSCSFNKAGCTYCGDGIKNGGESCDGGDLAGQTCASLGFNGGGSLSCGGDCAFNTGACQNIVCGNSQCQQGEDSCNCPIDCPDDPGLCSPCECGGFSQACACDDLCPDFGDCCPNGPC